MRQKEKALGYRYNLYVQSIIEIAVTARCNNQHVPQADLCCGLLGCTHMCVCVSWCLSQARDRLSTTKEKQA